MRRKTLDLLLILCMAIVFGCTLTGCDDTAADAADNADAAKEVECMISQFHGDKDSNYFLIFNF